MPPQLAGGAIIGDVASVYPGGEVVNYTCHSGYYPRLPSGLGVLPEIVELPCLEDGTWGNFSAECQGIMCVATRFVKISESVLVSSSFFFFF